MNKREMLLGGPGLDGYAFCADVYCVSCGQDFIRHLPKAEYTDLEAGDSEIVPGAIFYGESDTPHYCGKCGEYLYGPEEDSWDSKESENETES